MLCRSAARTLNGNLGAVGSKWMVAGFAVGADGSGALLLHRGGAGGNSNCSAL